jgi:hypothetical protein
MIITRTQSREKRKMLARKIFKLVLAVNLSRSILAGYTRLCLERVYSNIDHYKLFTSTRAHINFVHRYRFFDSKNERRFRAVSWAVGIPVAAQSPAYYVSQRSSTPVQLSTSFSYCQKTNHEGPARWLRNYQCLPLPLPLPLPRTDKIL